jgi:hypothetical protein
MSHPARILGETPVFADLDGDQIRDVVGARLAGGQYKIILALSARSEVMTLHTPDLSAGFRIAVFDVNQDSYQDIVITAPAETRPMAVWLGNGTGAFHSADRKVFGNESDSAETTWSRDCLFGVDPDLLTNSPDPVCGKIGPAFADQVLDPNGFICEHASPIALPNERRCLTLRGPPADSLT